LLSAGDSASGSTAGRRASTPWGLHAGATAARCGWGVQAFNLVNWRKGRRGRRGPRQKTGTGWPSRQAARRRCRGGQKVGTGKGRRTGMLKDGGPGRGLAHTPLRRLGGYTSTIVGFGLELLRSEAEQASTNPPKENVTGPDTGREPGLNASPALLRTLIGPQCRIVLNTTSRSWPRRVVRDGRPT